jgi:Amt family ammonium transporter
MYAAKATGHGRYEFFAHGMRVESRRRLELGHELRRAIDEHQLRVLYQPIFDLATLRMTGVEALVRWERPGHGLVPPSEFIPLAETTGFIDRLGEFVLETACRQVRAYQLRWPAAEGLELSVNVSPRQFKPGLAASVRQVLATTGLDPGRLKLEITETAVLEEADVAESEMAELRRLGVRIVIDDFGTGYSALGYFKRFGISGLKVDRTFIRYLGRDAEDRAIVTAALAFARALSLSVTAEGIEDPYQLDWLQQSGCEFGQGHHLARPLSAEALEDLLAIAA